MTIKEIAQLAGVSTSTVSKIVNNKADNINGETINRVLQIVKEYNYTPYGTIKSTQQSRSFLLGVLLRSATQTNRLVNGIMQAAQEAGYSILLYDSLGDIESELKHITSLCHHNVDGIIWEPVNQESCPNSRYFTERNIPFLYVNAPENVPSFHIEFSQMGYLLTEKLLACQHTNIACLIKPGSMRSEQVQKGFRQCLFDHQIAFQDSMLLSIYDNNYYAKMNIQGFTGIVSTHFASALKFYETSINQHYYIPSDLSLVSLKDDVREDMSFPSISSIRIPYYEFGYQICTDLISHCESGTDLSPCGFVTNWQLDHEESLNQPLSLRNNKLVVAGSINTDVVLNVDELPQTGKTLFINSASTFLGGKGANQAIGAARLGTEAFLIGKVGNDLDSTLVYDTLQKEHVMSQGVRRDPKNATGKAYMHVLSNAESTITVLPGANLALTPEDIFKHQYLFEGCGYCLLSTEISDDAVLATAKAAKKNDVKVILKPAASKYLPRELQDLIDIFVPNRKEASLLCPSEGTIEGQADYFYSLGIPVVIITLGHHGCYLKTEQQAKYFPAADFVSVDSTGGADAFIAALAAYLLKGYSLETSIQVAGYAAGFCVSRQGVTPALIDAASLENHIHTVQPDLL
ncbi:MAG: PfkB family carbohydrate kinase [Lachnospiraceae bacterium]|nr:PfkB family carbohydrate kinase [Lachnospiraceae bacterium]